MIWKTRITQMIGVKFPLIMGAFAVIGRAEFASAFSNADGLGIITAINYPDIESFQRELEKMMKLTDKPFGVNFTIKSPFILKSRVGRIEESFYEFLDVAIDMGIKIFKDLHFNPTYIPHLAIALKKLTDIPYPPKTLNLAGGKSVSRYKFAQMIADEFELDKKLLIPTSEVNGLVAERPKKAGLRTNKARKIGLPIYSIQDGLKELKYKWDSKQA